MLFFLRFKPFFQFPLNEPIAVAAFTTDWQ